MSLFSIRFATAVAGALSLVTGFAVARRLLPRGGATVALLVLAGLRWPLILSRYAWNSLALIPLVDVGTILVMQARRRCGRTWAASAGLVAGLGAHVYLAAWISGFALGCVLLWPDARRVPFARRFVLASLFGIGFLCSAAPVFLLHQGRSSSYFGRTTHQSIWIDYRRTHYWTLPFTIVADSIQAPWLIHDPERRHDLPRSRLGWIVGLPVAVALLRAVRSPRDDLAALFFCHAGAAVLASLRWGFPGHPNGLRFAYLTTVAAVAAGAGVLCLIGLAGERWRRPLTLAAFGALALAAALGSHGFFLWAGSRATFEAYWSDSTIVARADLRWQPYGRVRIDRDLPVIDFVVDGVKRYRLDPEGEQSRDAHHVVRERKRRVCFRIGSSAIPPSAAERRVEILRDAWGGDHGSVFASRCSDPTAGTE